MTDIATGCWLSEDIRVITGVGDSAKIVLRRTYHLLVQKQQQKYDRGVATLSVLRDLEWDCLKRLPQ